MDKSIILKSESDIVIELVDNFGLETAYKFIEVFGGSQIYIPKIDNISREYRDREIYKDYSDGLSIKKLVIKYKLTEKTIRTILNAERNKKS
ncbi:MAG: DNA-binding protein [Ruminococcus flavefaciens]|nr:DNA-binding protein [Ruminococcus flavefaciens]